MGSLIVNEGGYALADKEEKSVSLRLTPEQHRLMRHRMFVEGLNFQTVLNALANAYIVGDVSVTQEGRYTLVPPQGTRAIVEIPHGLGKIQVEPDWNINSDRPDVDPHNPAQNQRVVRWGTKELVKHLRKETGRNISIQILRKILKMLKVPKESGHHWSFNGPTDPVVDEVLEAIHNGTYDTLATEGVRRAEKYREKLAAQDEEIKEAKASHEQSIMDKRIKALQRIEEAKDSK